MESVTIAMRNMISIMENWIYGIVPEVPRTLRKQLLLARKAE